MPRRTYVTQDVDICCDFSAGNLLALQQALSGLHPVHRMSPSRKEFHLSEQDCAQFKNLYLDTNIGQLDCVSEVEGLGRYKEVAEASEVIETGGAAAEVPVKPNVGPYNSWYAAVLTLSVATMSGLVLPSSVGPRELNDSRVVGAL